MSCKYCESKYTYYNRTNITSPNIALVHLHNGIIFHTEENKYVLPAKFCPVCGKQYSVAVHNTERNYSNIIRNNIKAEIKAENMSITWLSKNTNIAKSTLSDFLIGKIDCLSADKIGLIADALKLPIERLFMPREAGLTYEEGLRHN